MELITCESCIIWERVISALEIQMIHLKMTMTSLIQALSFDLIYFSLYIFAMIVWARFKVCEFHPKNILPATLTLFFSTLAYSLMLKESESNYYVILTIFYVKLSYHYFNRSYKTSIACAIMAAYLLIMSREAAYYENYGSSFSDVLHNSYWLVIFILHCFIVCSLLSNDRYKRAYLGLRSRLRSS